MRLRSRTEAIQWRLWTLVLGALICVPLHPQESAAERHRMATNHLKQVAAEISARCLNDISSLADWQQQRPVLRKQLLEMLGLGSPPARTPLRARITGTLRRERYRIEKTVFESIPGLYVTGNIYLPHGTRQPLPAVLYLCGHAPHPAGAKFNYQDRAAWFAANGFACLIIDTLEFGEVPGLHHGLHDLNMWNWLSLGYTPAGIEVWNAIRAIDYLQSRPEVDAKRIGLTGISGGGAITWYTAAVDERVRAAAPVCSAYTFGSQAHHWRAAGQCDCIYFHNTYGWDFPVVAALIAPRPLLMINGRKDGDFPPDGYRQVYQRSKRIFEFHNAGGHIREFDDDVGHSDPPQFLREARQWMQQWLKEDTTPLPLQTNAPPLESPEDLAVLSNFPPNAINDQIHQLLTRPVALKSPKSRAAWARRSEQILSWVNEKVFGWFPSESSALETRVSRNDGGWAARYADYKEVSFQTEAGVRIRAQLLSPKSGRAGAPLLIYAKRAGDSIYFLDLDELLPVVGRQSVLILNPRFTEGSISASEYRDIQMTAAWTGRTIAAMQVWDILRALEWALEDEKLSPSIVSVYGKGEMGIVALHAAVRDRRIGRVILNDPPESYWKAPALLNILRITDVPEIAGALAPRELVSLTPIPPSFEITRRIYQFERVPGRFKHVKSLAQALEVWRIQE